MRFIRHIYEYVVVALGQVDAEIIDAISFAVFSEQPFLLKVFWVCVEELGKQEKY